MMAHERAFQFIANANGGTRASGTPGDDASADYVEERLRRAGYRVDRQEFMFRFYQETAPAELSQVTPNAKDFETGSFQYSGSGDVTARVQPVDVTIPPTPAPSSTSGCEASDFAGFTAGNIALIQRGTCTFGVKADNAEAAGAAAVIIFNEGQPGRTELVTGTLGEETEVDIPVVGASFADGQELYNLAQAGEVTARVFTAILDEQRPTSNVLAYSREGNADEKVVVGAHLDSVIEGPGINDNGSGSAGILEIAEELDETGLDQRLRRQLVFAFWDAEDVRPGRLRVLRRPAHPDPARAALREPELRHDRLAELRQVHLRRRQLGLRARRRQRLSPARPAPGRSRRSSGATSPARGWPAIRRLSAAARTTARSSPPASRRAACSWAARASKHPSKPQCTRYRRHRLRPELLRGGDDITNVNTTALGQMADAAPHTTFTLGRSRSGLFEDGSRVMSKKVKRMHAEAAR